MKRGEIALLFLILVSVGFVSGAVTCTAGDYKDNLQGSTLNSASLRIGDKHDLHSQMFKGVVDEVKIWNKVLSSNDVSKEYNNRGNSNGLVGKWSFENNLEDSSGNNDGSAGGDPDYVGGKISEGIKLDGDDYVSMGDVLDFDEDESFSISGWVKRDVSGRIQTIVSKVNDADNSQGYILTWDLDYLEFWLINNFNTGNYLKVQSVSAFGDTDWVHVAVTYDGSSSASGVTIYKDGVKVSGDTTNCQAGESCVGGYCSKTFSDTEIYNFDSNTIGITSRGVPFLAEIPTGEKLL